MKDNVTKFKQGNAGRPPGSPNKRTQELWELMEKEGCNPARFLAQVVNDKVYIRGKDASGKMVQEHYPVTVNQRVAAANKLMPFLYPQRKAIDMGNGAEGILETFANLAKQIA